MQTMGLCSKFNRANLYYSSIHFEHDFDWIDAIMSGGVENEYEKIYGSHSRCSVDKI